VLALSPWKVESMASRCWSSGLGDRNCHSSALADVCNHVLWNLEDGTTSVRRQSELICAHGTSGTASVFERTHDVRRTVRVD